MSNWNHYFEPPSPAQIEQFETMHGLTLPPRYRDYLVSENGGQPISHRVFMIPEINEKVVLGVLFGLSDKDRHNSLNLNVVIAEFADDCPHGYLPIGEDPGGNHLLLALSGNQQDNIVFYDRVGILARRFGKSLFVISDSIQDLVGSLHSA